MEQHRVMGVLSAILAAACLILAVLLARVTRAREYLPESETADLVAVLAQSGIEVDPALVSTRRQSAAVYVCNSGDYAATVAELLTGSVPARTYVVPDGEILVTESGERMEFFGDFSFRYSADGTAPGEGDAFGPTFSSRAVSGERRDRIAEAAAGFLDRGSRTFEGIGRWRSKRSSKTSGRTGGCATRSAPARSTGCRSPAAACSAPSKESASRARGGTGAF